MKQLKKKILHHLLKEVLQQQVNILKKLKKNNINFILQITRSFWTIYNK